MRPSTKWALALFFLAGAAPISAAAQEAWPRDTAFEGPVRFCSATFAVDVSSDEVATVRDPGLDFTITYIESESSWMGVYEGNHPQTTGKKIRRTRFFTDVRVDRMTDKEGATSYLIHATTDATIPVYLHVFSSQFVGSDADRAILQRFAFGDFAKTGCSEVTYRRS